MKRNKKIKLIILSILIVFINEVKSQTPNGLWQNTNVFNGYVNAVRLFKSGNNLFAGDTYEMHFSSDKGATWTIVDDVDYHYNSFTLIDSIIYVSAESNGIYRSFDKGNQWFHINSGLNDLTVRRLVSSGIKILAGSLTQLYYSTLNDTVWLPLTNGLPNNVTVFPLLIDGNNFYAASEDSILYKSINNGLNWFPINNGLTSVKVLSLIIEGNTLYAGTTKGVYMSVNGGNNWLPINNGINNFSVYCLAIKDNKIFIGTLNNGAFISTNNGNTWYPINDGFGSLRILSFTIVDSLIYAGTSDGLYKRELSDIAYIQGTNNLIQGAANVCKNTNINYVISPIPNANSYTWTLPNGATGNSNTNSINISFGYNADNGNIKVKKTGDSVFYSLAVTVEDKPYISLSPQFNYYLPGFFCNSVYAIAVDKQGNKWLATDNGLVKFIDINNSTIFNNIQIPNYRNSIVVDLQNNIWVVTTTGIAKYDGTNFTFYNSFNSTIAGQAYIAITVDKQDNIWVTSEVGFSKFDGNTWINYSIPNNYQLIPSIKADDQSNIWLAIENNGGVYKFDGLNFQHFNTTNSGLCSNDIYSIATDNQNNIWFGGYGGISKFDGINWVNYTANNNPDIAYVKYIYIDEFNNKWILTNNNLIKFDNFIWTNYSSVYSGSSLLLDDYGICWIGIGPINNYCLISLNANIISGLVNVCQGQNGVTYSIPNIPNTTSYIWQLPSGVTGSSSTNSISVNFTNTAQSGNISVMAHNNCGNSDTVSFPIVVQNCTGINEVNKTISNLKVFPNPFSNTTTFTYTLKENQKVNLSIYDITGRMVKQLVNENQSQGEHALSFNAAGLQAGIYYYRLEAGDEVATGKLILSK